MKRNFKGFIYRAISPFFDPYRLLFSFPRYARFIKDLSRYSKMEGAETIHLFDIYPCLHDRTQITKADYYFYQDIWAFKRIYESKAKHHVDVGSRAILLEC